MPIRRMACAIVLGPPKLPAQDDNRGASFPEARLTMSLDRGSRFGHYEIAALIGVGGMGEVYRATDTTLKRDVALKVLPESLVADASRLARLQREAELLAALNHPNVAHIYGVERLDGRMALVMELIEGPTLDERIAQGALPPSEALNLALQIVAALEAAHERSIVHRDLKPQNIKVKPDGTLKVLDFGIAKALDARQTSGPQIALTTPTMATQGIVLGTAAYMSPEQARGKSVDRRADVWAFGCVLYEMLTGKAAFLGDDVTTTLAKVLERDPDMRGLPSGLPPAVRSTLELCLQKDPKKRLRDIGDVRLALEGQLVGAAAGATRPLWRRALPIAAGVAVGAVVAGVLVVMLVGPRESRPAAQQQVSLPVTRFVVTPDARAPLANLGGYDVMISPDGQRIAYFGEDAQSGDTALYVREIDGLEARLVPGTEIGNQRGAGGNMNPFFSADSRSIGFLSPGRGVVRVALDGGPATKIADSPMPAFLGASWSAGDTLVFSSGRALHRVSAAGGTPVRLTEERRGAFLASPVVLPGGRAVMYGLIEGGVERVAVYDVDTREEKVLIENGQNAFYSDTGHIVFARGTTIMAVPFRASELAVTGEPVVMVENVRHPSTQTAADFALSASGTLVYVPTPPAGEPFSRSSAVWVDRSGRVAGRAVAEPLDNPRDPRLSPDGTRLALTIGNLADGDLWSYDLRGRPPIRLAVINDDRNPVWSPDSKQVAFMVVVDGTDANIHTVPADGSALTPRPLRPERTPGVLGAWSAAGDLLYMLPPLATSDIVAISAAGDAPPRAVVDTDYTEMDPALSRDGRWLAWASNRTGRLEIWVQRYPEGVPVRVSSNGGYEPRWSADGRELYYLEGNAVMAVSVQAGDDFSFTPPQRLFSGPYAMTQIGIVSSYDVASDGRFLMIEVPGAGTNEPAPGIVVVQNWTEELERRVPGR